MAGTGMSGGVRALRLQAARVWRLLRRQGPSLGLMLVALLHRFRGKGSPAVPGTVRHILVVRLDGLGDLIMTTPLFEELKQRYPAARITALVQPSGAGLLDTSPFVDAIVHPLPVTGRLFPRLRREAAMVQLYRRQLQQEEFDLVLHPRLGPDYYAAGLLLALMSRTARCVKYEEIADNRINMHVEGLASAAVHRLRRPAVQHEVRSNLAFVEQVTGVPATAGPRIFLTEEDRAQARRTLADAPAGARRVAVSFGAQAERRRWPLDRWVETLELLAEEYSPHVLVLCARADQKEGEHLCEHLNRSGLSSTLLCGSHLRVAAACLEGCDLFLGTDSGLAHLSAAVGCPSVIVSPHPADGDPAHENSPMRFRPWGETAHVVRPAHGLAPCSGGCDAIDPHCILQVGALEVALACAERMPAARQPLPRVEVAQQAAVLAAPSPP